jgi:D-amino-acid dehydrogenase
VKIAVLGAGVIGVTSAWYLAERGHEVTLLDRRAEPGMETSFANGGQISAGHAEPWAKPAVVPRIFAWLGREDAPLLFRPRADWAQWEWGLRFLRECLPGRFERNCRALAGLAVYSRRCLRELRSRTGIHYDELSRGILHFCTDERDFEALARHAEAMRPLGIRREVKSAAECLAIEPALGHSASPVVGGVYTPEDESGDARKFTVGLARLGETKGIRWSPGSEIHSLEANGDAVSGARMADGTVAQADAFVVCLGSYSPLLLRPLGIRLALYPLKGYSITLDLAAAAPSAPQVSLNDEAQKIVISRLGDRLRAAGTAELAGYDRTVNDVRCDAILARIRKLFPALAGCEVADRWAGLRPATPDNVPLVGATRFRNLFVNTGHGTLGWTLACGSGRALAELVSGRRPEVDFPFLR